LVNARTAARHPVREKHERVSRAPGALTAVTLPDKIARRFRPIGEGLMRRALALASGVLISALVSLPVFAQGAPDVTLMRFADCGTPQGPNDVSGRFTDTFAYGTKKLVEWTFSCYLIKHGDDYMIWDTGQSMGAGAVAPKKSLVDQLAELQLKPEQIKVVGISHMHPDHTGQARSFPGATLLIGKGDWDVLNSSAAGPMAVPLTHWLKDGGKAEPVPQDKDVFGDGTVIMLNTPGHTPGHHSLMVRLKDMGPVLLLGDLAHFRENYDSDGVPNFNASRADTVASLDRVKKIAANLKATVILQHDARDIGKLPAFPAAAK
jgi:glyoxylase-like metal-dependent hydrolase (beta-lactamase superfamily II)